MTGQTRGILHYGCNTKLAVMELTLADGRTYAEAAAEYLDKFKEDQPE